MYDYGGRNRRRDLVIDKSFAEAFCRATLYNRVLVLKILVEEEWKGLIVSVRGVETGTVLVAE